MKKLNLFLLLLCGLVAACTTEDPAQNVDKPVEQDVEVKFKAYIQQATRATETSFEKGDAISVFAVEPSANISLEASGNYADNIKYVYNGSTFEASADAIKFDDSYEEGLAYFAIYPYSYSVSSKYTFSVKNDQSSLENYTASDLCVAYNAPTTDETVLLEFNHSLSNVVIKFQGSNLASKNLSVELSDVYTSCDVDINSNTFKAKGSKQNVVMGEESGNTFHAIIVPQTVSADDTFMIVTVGGKQIALSLNQTTEFKSGRKITYEYEIQDDKIVAIGGYINPWNEEEEVQNSFEQSLYTSTYEKGEAYPYNSLFFDWVGKNVKGLKYRLYKTSTLSGYTDSEIINNLGVLDDAGMIAEINNGGAISYYFSNLDASTSYTLCTYVTFANGNTKFVKSACSTEASPNLNKFNQTLYTTDEYEHQGLYAYNSLFLGWSGSNISGIKYALFKSETIANANDSAIIKSLSNSVASDGISEINSSGVKYYFSGLNGDTSYTLCTYVTFKDGQQTLYKTEASTAEIPYEERLETVVPEDPEPANTKFNHRVLLIDHTGVNCGYCPRATDNLKALAETEWHNYYNEVTCHAGSYASGDPANSAAANALNSVQSRYIYGYPTIIVNFNYPCDNYSSSTIQSVLKTVVNKNGADVGISLAVNGDSTNVYCAAQVKSAKEQEYKVVAWLLESNIYSPNQSGATMDYHKIYNFALRNISGNYSKTNVQGESVGVIAAGETMDFAFELPIISSKWAYENMDVLVIVSAKDANGRWEVANTALCHIGESKAYEYVK